MISLLGRPHQRFPSAAFCLTTPPPVFLIASTTATAASDTLTPPAPACYSLVRDTRLIMN
ncbi:hypothetical protein E2C01_093340 [Portunus trituberculatus]|uniref:Uncharacterized protein n=1 Tax=Portunus trituberculatus TaxID=210409 RepID=A0A5B7JIQ5_PORTR|nr:hypothetical protein [Portunus trituberculatus]